MEVFPVVTDRDLHAFLHLPWRIYRGDPHWVPPLLLEQRQLLTRQHPFFEKAEIRLFLAREGGEVVGRIAAIVDHHFLESHHEPVAFFGFFECLNDRSATRELFGAVQEFLRGKGMQAIRGPVNPSMHDPCGLLIDGFESAPVFLMPYNPPTYSDLLEEVGCRKVKDLLAYTLRIWTDPPPKVLRSAEEARRRGIQVRQIDLKRLGDEVRIICELYNTAWQNNWGFTPMTQAEAEWMAKNLRLLIVPSLTLIAEAEGNPIGFLMLLPDYNQAVRHLNGRLGPLGFLKFLWYRRRIRDVRLLLLGMRPAYRGKGVDSLLNLTAFQALKQKGYIQAEISWILEDNWVVLRMAERLGGALYKRYRIYELPV
ncbi:MAG: GNAT family N-acetyltransferase [Candidatus Methylomirabilales bacterium]